MKRLLALLWIVLLLTACAAPPGDSTGEPDAVTSATMKRYREGELREYNGTKLDPAVGPRDNSIKGVQQVDISSYQLVVDGLVDTPASYTYEQVKALPGEQRLVTIYCVEGWNATILWKGVTLKSLFETAGVQPEANTVIFHATDGYTTSLPLQEILDNDLMLAYDANGIALPPEMGYPFILVAQDKWGYKWARWVSRIELSDDASYQGYWETRGYSSEGNLNEPSR